MINIFNHQGEKMKILEKLKNKIKLKSIIIKILIILFSLSITVIANPSGEKTVSAVATLGPATAAINLTMFSKSTIIGNAPVRGEIKGITLAKVSHNEKDLSVGAYWMGVSYRIEDTLNGDYKLSNIKVKITNASSASSNVTLIGNVVRVEIDDYVPDDTNKQAVVEITGDLTYIANKDSIGMGSINATARLENANNLVTTQILTLPLEVNYAITLKTQPLNFGDVIPMTGKYEKKSSIDINGAKGTEVTISLNGKNGQEIKEKLVNNGRNEIPIVYRVENMAGNLIGDLRLEGNGNGSAILKGIINSNDIPKNQVGGSYTGSVTVEVDYK